MAETPVEQLLKTLMRSEGDFAQRLQEHLESQTFVGGKRVPVQPLPKLPQKAATEVHRVKASLYGAKPPIWRRLEIPSAIPLAQLHEVMQIAFGWHDFHLHSFERVCGEFGPVDEEDFAARKDETKAALGQVAATVKVKIVYTYDFGDDWRHDIVVEQIVQAEPGVSYPRCTGGRRSVPREDSGGIWAHDEDRGDDLPFDPNEVAEELTSLAQVLIPARPSHLACSTVIRPRRPTEQCRRFTAGPPAWSLQRRQVLAAAARVIAGQAGELIQQPPGGQRPDHRPHLV
jgi:hypothetical protein